MSESLVTVAFACNDDQGAEKGRTEAVHFVSEEHGDVDLCCQMPRGQTLRHSFPWPKLTSGIAVRVGRKVFEARGWTPWYGNMAWNATQMTAAEAERLLRYLLACGYTVEGHDLGTRFAGIIAAHEARASGEGRGER